MTDFELLTRFTQNGDATAFAEVVRRNTGVVYGSALRQIADHHLAEEITQAVFVLLAKRGTTIRSGPHLVGFLLTTTRYAALDAMKRRKRETARTAPASEIGEIAEATPNQETWRELEPFLDRAVATLSEQDQLAITARYFQGRSLRDVALALSCTEEAAKKRVARALEKMRRYFAGRGVAVPASSFVTAIGAFESVTAPATLAEVAAKCALNANLLSPVGSQLVQAATKSLFVAKVQLMGTAAVAAVIAATATITTLESPRPSAEPASLGKRVEVLGQGSSAATALLTSVPSAPLARATGSKPKPQSAMPSVLGSRQRPMPFSAAIIVKQELSPGPAAIQSKLEDITLQKVQFRDTRLPDALKLLERQIRAADPTGTGVPLFGAGKEDTKITLTLHQVPALEVVKYLTNLSGSDYRITEFGVEIRPVGKN